MSALTISKSLQSGPIDPSEVMPAPRATVENIAAVAEFLGWLAELHDAGHMYLIACDSELGENFAKIRNCYPAVLAAVREVRS
jgi:hypothetical protein